MQITVCKVWCMGNHYRIQIFSPFKSGDPQKYKRQTVQKGNRQTDAVECGI